jgi:O-antigen/teichoic acid export membrane protein
VIDKVSFAASNFFSNILLANWLSQQEYGSFSVALAIFFLVAALHSTLLSEPMLVFGPGKYREHLPLYIGMIFWGHWILAILASILILLSAWGAHYYGQSVLAASLVAMAFASPCILLQWIMRKITYVDGNPHLAAYAGALYLLAMLVGITSLYYLRYLSSVSTFGVMAVSSIFSVCWMIRRIPIRAALRNRFLFQTCLKDHAGYGRWAMGSAFLRWLPSNSYYLFLSIWGGLEASAALRSLMNLLLPFQQLTLALSDVLVPTLVRIRRWKDFKSLALKTLLIWLMASGLYWGCLALFGKTIMMWIYGGRYIEHAGLLWLIALSLVFGTFGAVLGVFLRAVNKPDSIFRAGLCATIITAPFALAAIFFGGLRGTALAITFGSLMTAATMAWFCWQGLDSIRTSKAESLESLL